MTILKTLSANHRELESLLKRLDATSERSAKTRDKLFKEFKAKLLAHVKSEEVVVYDRLREEKSEVKERTLESYEEHHIVNVLIRELTLLRSDNERWGAKLAVLRDVLEHHIAEEERVLFAMVRRVVDAREMEEMGDEFERLRDAHLSGFGGPARLFRKAQHRLAG